MKKKLSIVDIAKQLNVSPTTISFILNGKAKEKRISDELAEHVLKQIEISGYKANSLAQSLRTGKTSIIGLMVENIANPFFANVARLIEEKAYKNGYKIIYCSTANDTEKTKDLLKMLSERHVDGYIISPPEGVESDINQLIENNSPVILFDRYLPNTLADYVGINNEESTYNATIHLITNGYKEIAFVTLDSLQSQMQDRLRGYERALAEHGLNQHVKEISYHQTEDMIHRHIIHFFDRKKNIDAVLFSTNYLGVSGLKAIREMGLRIPEDLAVVAYDDNSLFEMYSPSITAIAQPVEDISERLITSLLNRLNSSSKIKKAMNDVVKTTLIERSSSGIKDLSDQ